MHRSSKVSLGTFSLMFSHSCLVAGLHFLLEMLEQFSSSSYLVMVAGTLRQTSSGMSLQTSRGVETSLQTWKKQLRNNYKYEAKTIYYLLLDLVTLPAGYGGALTLGDLLSLDPGHQGTGSPGLLLAVSDGGLPTRLAAELLAVNLGHLDTPHLRFIEALLAGEAAALTVSSLLAVGPGDVLAFLLLHSLALPLIDILAGCWEHSWVVMSRHTS